LSVEDYPGPNGKHLTEPEELLAKHRRSFWGAAAEAVKATAAAKWVLWECIEASGSLYIS